jgi:hypothetical protein
MKRQDDLHAIRRKAWSASAMLEPWVIDEIRRRDQGRRSGDRPRIEIPAPGLERPRERDLEIEREERNDSAPERGVLIIKM